MLLDDDGVMFVSVFLLTQNHDAIQNTIFVICCTLVNLYLPPLWNLLFYSKTLNHSLTFPHIHTWKPSSKTALSERLKENTNTCTLCTYILLGGRSRR